MFTSYHLLCMQDILGIVGHGEFLPNDSVIDKLGKEFCRSEIQEVCANVLFLICGFDEKHLNAVR